MPTPETTAREALRAAIAAVSGMIVDADAVVRQLEARGFTVAMLLPSGQTPREKCEAAVDRARARSGRLGYEKHPEFGKGVPSNGES